MIYYLDLFLFLVNFCLLIYLIGYMIYRRRFTHGGNLLLALIILLSITGLSDIILRWNPNPALILLANAVMVFCFLFGLTIVLHFSLFSFTKSDFLWANELYLFLYLPALILSFTYALTPFMLSGIIHNPFGFWLIYAPGYWIIVILSFGAGLGVAGLELGILLKNISAGENHQAVLSLLIFALLFFYYVSSLVLPFFSRSAYFPSSVILTLAIVLLIYEFVKYHFYSLESV